MNSARMLSERIKRENQVRGPSMQYGDVQAVHEGDKVLLDVQVDDGLLALIPMTTACQGVKVGDRVVVMTVGRSSIVTGILARDNGHHIKQAFGSASITFANGSRGARAFLPLDFVPSSVIACPGGAAPGYSCSTQIYDDGRGEIVMHRSGTSGQVTRTAFWAAFA